MATIKSSKKEKSEVTTSVTNANEMNFDFLKNFSLEKFKTIEATDGEALKKFKNIDGKEEMDIYVFVKKK